MAPDPPLRIGFVPGKIAMMEEHFSTPLHFAQSHYSLGAKLVPFPSGTGHMITALQAKEIDIGIGLSEGWIAGLGKAITEGKDAGFKLIGSYVETPLCWAISTGNKRDDMHAAEDLKGKKVGVSRIGSGSYVMSFVLADQRRWLSAAEDTPFDVVPLQTFTKLREAVNDGTADFFMWEHFTSKRYYDNGEIRKIGEIYTPWPSWLIVSNKELVGDLRMEAFMEKLNLGVQYFNGHHDEAVEYISSELDYSEEDARQWLQTVQFAEEVRGVKASTVEKVVEVLKKAGVLGENVGSKAVEQMIAIRRKE